MYVAKVILHCGLDVAAEAKLFHRLSELATKWTNEAVSEGFDPEQMNEGFDQGFFEISGINVVLPTGQALEDAALNYGMFDQKRKLALADFCCGRRGRKLLEDWFEPQLPANEETGLNGYIVFRADDQRVGTIVVLNDESPRTRLLAPNIRNTILAQY